MQGSVSPPQGLKFLGAHLGGAVVTRSPEPAAASHPAGYSQAAASFRPAHAQAPRYAALTGGVRLLNQGHVQVECTCHDAEPDNAWKLGIDMRPCNVRTPGH